MERVLHHRRTTRGARGLPPIGFLKASAASFDAGFEAEAKRLAVTIRVLLHNTTNSHSLLDQIGVKEQMAYVDTALRINPLNLLPVGPGLVLMRMTQGVGADYFAPLDVVPLSPSRIHLPAPFSSWWTEEHTRDADGALWSRKKFVLVMANKEGGAHVDPNLNSAYENLAKQNGLGYISNVTGDFLPLDGNVAAISVRQITHELVKTLEAHGDMLN
ncbi:hypothetical protein ACIHCQ_01210 [Streptomyces sp. NPDC052236]|uniref:hypothetical protein n=1 Tax=Streptomyces sp. NPDC052236 TaxID=3365686 RepID=UPI0037D5E680